MKGFKLDENNDVVISETYRDIDMTQGADLTRQAIQTTLNTNKGEWFFDLSEGVNFRNILGKNKNKEAVQNEVIRGLAQIDPGMLLKDFQLETGPGRKAKVTFTAQGPESTEEVKVTWQ